MTFAYLLSLQLRRNKHTLYNCVIVNLLCVKYVALEIRINASSASSKTGRFVMPQFYIHRSIRLPFATTLSFIPVHHRKHGFVDPQLLSPLTARTCLPMHHFNGHNQSQGSTWSKSMLRTEEEVRLNIIQLSDLESIKNCEHQAS